MDLTLIEALGSGGNWGRFAIGRHDKAELNRVSEVDDGQTVLRAAGRTGPHNDLWVLDLVTGEGARFLPGGYAKADLDKHRIWVCPLFEPFLTWLYEQDLSDLNALPRRVTLDVPLSDRGYRRPGPEEAAPL